MPVPMKYCPKCGKTKLTGEFKFSKMRTDGLSDICAACDRAVDDALEFIKMRTEGQTG